MATAQTGAMVITNGRIVSLAECELRSKASKTRTVPNSSTTNAMPTQTRVFALMRRNGSPAAGILVDMALLFGFHMPNYTYPGVPDDRLFDHVIEQARAAEAAGFDLVTVMDHLYQIRGVGPETDPMLEAYTTLAAIAAQTKKVKLGTLVAGVTYRNPALLAKQVTTLDVISKGRAILGIGAAWNEDEHQGYGFEFPPIARRMDRLEEAVTIAKLMFTEDRPSFEGKFYRIERALNVPRPIQKGGPKILIGGGGEKRTLRILAQHGDIGHWFGGPLEELKRKKGVFEEHCAAVGRNPSDVLLTIGVGIILVKDEAEAKPLLDRVPPERRAMVRALNVEQAAEFLRPYIDAGFGGFTFNNPTLATPEAIGRAGELIKSLRGSSVAA
ncbi:MAG: LLM class F420-dependent oxidoreductase [Chloroflexi bacterium]|nr:MAG: LLM class F420-dependent oxidoreductase [Chloroflexota bacterium]